jgi:filamentous hemagglutinin family protein
MAFPWLGSLTVSGILVFNVNQALAQITPDNTLSNESSIVNTRDASSDSIDGGAIRGQNLFHSFLEFNVDAGRGVYFSNPDAVTNIFSRVTGNDVSDILGTLGVDGAANLFLINPNGIIFGEGASLDVNGSFAATTASGIEFGEQGFFSATNPEAPQLLTINPSAYLFNQVAPGAIAINSQAAADFNPSPSFDDNFFGLRVPDNQSLLLLGGNVNADGGGLVANGGRIDIGAVAGKGIIGLNNNGSLNIPDSISRGDVSLTNGAGFLVAGGGGGDIAIAANNISLDSASSLNAGIFSNLGSPNAQAGDINLNAKGAISVNTSEIYNFVNQGAKGNAGNINVETQKLNIQNNTIIAAYNDGEGNVGDFRILADDSIKVSGDSFLSNLVNYNGTGSAGDFRIQTKSLVLENQGTISVENRGFGNTGDLIIKTKTLQSKDSSISVNLRGTGGNAGDLKVNASERIELSGELLNNDGSILSPGGIKNQVDIGGKGQGGNLAVETPILSVSNGSKVQAATFGIGNPGKLLIRASEVKVFDTPNSQNQFNTGIFAGILQDPRITELPQGKETSLTIDTEKLSVRGGAEVSTQTQGKANAGDIFIQARDSVEVVGSKNGNSSFIGSEVNSPGSITVNTEEITGQGGNVTIKTGQLNVRDGGRITASTFATGDAGNVKIEASNSVILSEDGSGIFAEAAPNVKGRGGNLTIQTGKFFINKNAQISAKTEFGEGGNIFLQVNNNLILRNNSTISSQAGKNANGGNINITADAVIAFDDSDIFAFAADGQGGNITLNTPAYFAENFTLNSLTRDPDLLENNSRADINATGAVSGNVSIPDVSFIQNSLNDLPNNSINTDELVANSCVSPVGNRQEGKFIITGKGGLPARPGNGDISDFATGDVRNVPSNQTSWKRGDPIIEPQGLYHLSNGKLVLSRECR